MVPSESSSASVTSVKCATLRRGTIHVVYGDSATGMGCDNRLIEGRVLHTGATRYNKGVHHLAPHAYAPAKGTRAMKCSLSSMMRRCGSPRSCSSISCARRAEASHCHCRDGHRVVTTRQWEQTSSTTLVQTDRPCFWYQSSAWLCSLRAECCTQGRGGVWSGLVHAKTRAPWCLI
jgi:hypothetical protein